MGSGQMMMVAIAILLIGKLVLSGNESVTIGQGMVTESEAIATATGIGQSMLERITCRSYDDSVARYSSPDRSSFRTIGLDAGEIAGKDTSFDDIDDYNGFVDSVSTPRFGKYFVSCKVYFVNETAPYDSTASKTYTKRVDILVNNTFMVDTTGKDPDKLTGPLSLYQVVTYY
jgi:hypothetical protein